MSLYRVASPDMPARSVSGDLERRAPHGPRHTIGLIAGTLVTVLVVGYLAANLYPLVKAQFTRHEVAQSITRGLATETAAAADEFASIGQNLGTTEGQSVVIQDCDFSSNDSGWVVNDYIQHCELRTVAAWPVDSESEAVELMASRTEYVDIHDGQCLSYDEGWSSRGRYESREFTYVPGDAIDDCMPNSTSMSQERVLTGALPELDASRDWLVLVERTELVDEVIGCGAWWVLPFCTNPFGDELVWGEVPQTSEAAPRDR